MSLLDFHSYTINIQYTIILIRYTHIPEGSVPRGNVGTPFRKISGKMFANSLKCLEILGNVLQIY